MQPTSDRVEVTLAAEPGSTDSTAAARFGIRESGRDEDRWQFVRHNGSLVLCAPRAEGPMRLEVRATAAALTRRFRTVRRTDALPRAVGLGRPNFLPTIVDATGGICRDAMTLASLGCQVTVLERIPALALFGHCQVAAAGLGDRVAVHCVEAGDWLASLGPEQRPAVVYLDPMFATHGKAQVKKEMQVCRRLAGSPGDPTPLLAAARAAARDRVVVKRHPDLPPLADGVSFAVDSDRVRFDVYLTPDPANPSAVNAPRSPM